MVREFLEYHERRGFSFELESITLQQLDVRMRRGDDELCGTTIISLEKGVLCIGLIDMKDYQEEEADINR